MAAIEESHHPHENGEAACENHVAKQDSTSSSTDDDDEEGEELEVTEDTQQDLPSENTKDALSMETIRALATQALALSIDDWSSLPTIHYQTNNEREEEEDNDEDALFESVVSILWVRMIVAMERDEKPCESDNEDNIANIITTEEICRGALFVPKDSEHNSAEDCYNKCHHQQPWRISCSNQLLEDLRKLVKLILTTSTSTGSTEIDAATHDELYFHNMQRAVAVLVHANKLIDLMNANAKVDPMLSLSLLFAALVGYRTCHNPVGAFRAAQSGDRMVLMPDMQNDAAVASFFEQFSKPEYQLLFTTLFQDDEEKYRHFRNTIISGVVMSNADNTANAIHLDYSMSWNDDSRWIEEDFMKTTTPTSRFMAFGNSSYRQQKTSRPLTHRVPRRGSNQSDEYSDATPTQHYASDDFVIVDGTGRRSSLSMVRNSFDGNEPVPPSRGMGGRHLSLEMDHQLPYSGGRRLSLEFNRNRRMSGDGEHRLGHSTNCRRGSMYSEVSDITTDLALLQQSPTGRRRLPSGIRTADRRGSLFSEASDVSDDLQSELSLSPKRRVGGRRRASLDFVPPATRRLSNDSLTGAADRKGANSRPKRLSLDFSAPSSRRYSNDFKNLYDLGMPQDHVPNCSEFRGRRSRKLRNPYGFDSFDDDDDGEESIADSVALLRPGASGNRIDLLSELAKEFDPSLVKQLLAKEEPNPPPATRGVGRSKSSDSASITRGVRRTKSNDSSVGNMTGGSFGAESIDVTRKRMQGGKLSRDHRRFGGRYPVDLSLGDDDEDDDDEEESTSLSATSEDHDKSKQTHRKTVDHGKNNLLGITDSPSPPESPEQLMRARRRDSTGLSGLRFSPASLGLRIDEEMLDISDDHPPLNPARACNLQRRTSMRRSVHTTEDASEGQDSLHLTFLTTGEVVGRDSNELRKVDSDDSGDANVVDLLLRASQIGEYLQGWENMVFWVQRQYFELEVAQRRGKGLKPLDDFYEETIGFLNGYVKPLAWQLDSSGLFGEANGVMFAKNVDENKELWITHGVELVAKWEQEIVTKRKKRVVEL